MLAAQNGHLEVVKFLVQAGADKERISMVGVEISLYYVLVMTSFLFSLAGRHSYWQLTTVTWRC
jgi:hypothetical protein